mgnify:CR=1 FL=1
MKKFMKIMGVATLMTGMTTGADTGDREAGILQAGVPRHEGKRKETEGDRQG